MHRRVVTAALTAVAAVAVSLPFLAPAQAAPAGVINTVIGGVSTGPALTTGMYPLSVTVRNNKLYVGDAANYVVREVDLATGATRVIAGARIPLTQGDGGPATAAGLQWASDIVFDGSGNLYIADNPGHRVRKVDTTGTITTYAGGGNPADGVGDGGPATAGYVNPTGLAFDGAGDLHIVDYRAPGSSRIRRVDAAGNISTVAGGGNPADTIGDGGPATAANLNQPSAIAFDGNGNLYIAQPFRLRKVTPLGAISTLSTAVVAHMSAIVVEPNNDLLISQGYTILRYTQAGQFSTVINLPHPNETVEDMWRAPSGELYVGHGTHVERIGTDLSVTTVAGNGTSAFTGEGVAATSAELSGMGGFFVQTDGTTYVYDGRVRKVSPGGVITTVGIVGPDATGSGDPAPIPAGGSSDMGVDAAGNVYIIYGNFVKKVTPAGVVSDLAHIGFGVRDMVVEPNGIVYVAHEDDVLRIDPSGASSVLLHDLRHGKGNVVDGPHGLALDGAGNLYVAYGDIYKLNLATKAYTRVAHLPITHWALSDFEVDAAGNIYYSPTDVTDYAPPRFGVPLGGTELLRIDPQGFVTHIAGAAKFTWGFAGDGGSAKNALFYGIDVIAFDRAGNVLIGDAANRRIRRIDTPGLLPRDANAINVRPRTKAESYVDHAHRSLLFREATAAEVAAGATKDRFAVSAGIVTSREYRTALVRSAFLATVGREPTANESSVGVSILDAGYTVPLLMAILLASDETVAKRGGNDTAWIAYLYGLVTGRAADPAAVNFWVQQRAAGLPRLTVAYAFVTWDEAYRTVVRGAYFKYLGLIPDPSDAGVNFWVTQLRNGLRHEYLDAAFVASDLYYDRAVYDPITVSGHT